MIDDNSQSDAKRSILKLLSDLNALCFERGVHDGDRLELFQLAWLTMAARLRNDALALPGGYREEQARQVAALEQMLQLVGTDTPDLEAERLFQEEKHDELQNHYRRQLDALRRTDNSEGGVK
jgi:hypothetical protein